MYVRESPLALFTPPPMLRPSGVIFVPGRSGAKLLRIHTGIAACTTRVQGFRMQDFRTKVSELRGFTVRDHPESCALLERAAGPLSTLPSNRRVQMMTSSASIAAPRIVAE